MDHEETCIVCQRSSKEVPLLAIHSQGNSYWICPSDLPVLIHKPQQLSGKLPGVENLAGHQH